MGEWHWGGSGEGEKTLWSVKEEEEGDPNTPVPHPLAPSEPRHPLTRDPCEPSPRETDFVFVSREPGRGTMIACHGTGPNRETTNQT